MAVQPQTPYIEYTANGTTTGFNLGFDCDDQDHLIVLVNNVEPVVGAWSLTGGAVVFGAAPADGNKITIQRNTPFERKRDYQSYDNSFRPPTVNKDFDWIWLKLQELGVADWILGNRIDALKNYVNLKDGQLQTNIDNLKSYVDGKDDELRNYLLNAIREQGVALDQLENYYNYLMERLAQIAVDKGWDASFVVDGDKNQHQLNNEFKKSIHTHVHNIEAIKSIDEPIGTQITLHDGLRSGEFIIRNSSDEVPLDKTRSSATIVALTAAAAQDTYNAIYIQTLNGVAVRVIDSEVHAGWWGVLYDWNDETQSGTDNTLKFEAAMHYALCQQLTLLSAAGSVRVTRTLNSQKDGYWKKLRWHSDGTRIIVDHTGSGIRFIGGGSRIRQTGALYFEKSYAFKTTGGNPFPIITDLNNFLASNNAGVIFDGNQHSIDYIEARGFGVGALFYAGSNMNHSEHFIWVEGNDLGALIFGPNNDISVIKSEILAHKNYQEGIYVKDGTNLRQWVARFRAENNLLDRIINPAIAGRYAVYIGHHVACDFWCYVEQYEATTPGTYELYVSETGSSEVYSARKNNDRIRGNNQGRIGNTLYQHFYTNPPTIRQAIPLKLEGRGVRLSNENDYVDLPLMTDTAEYGGLRGQAGRIKLRSATATQEVSISDSDVQIGKRFNTTVTEAVTLLRASPSISKVIKTLVSSSEPVMGTLHAIGGALSPANGYSPYILKVDFYIISGVITLNETTKMYRTNAEGKSSAALRVGGNVLYLDLTYEPGWWGDDYKFKYKVELLTGIQ